jgi:D-aspartate ligase
MANLGRKSYPLSDHESTPIAAGVPVGALDSTVGAVVLGGDYQGLGIARSLGRRGIPVCVVDNEKSIARFSRYCTRFVKVADLRHERETIDALLKIGKRFELNGWVLYPTRDENVAALSRNRSELASIFRIPTPEWNSIQWAWDKRNTYRLAGELGIPTPATYYPQSLEDLSKLDDLTSPFAIKPAIKEHFIYATKAKGWRADSHTELRERFKRASELVHPGEVMVQEFIPGNCMQQFAFCAFFREGKSLGKMTVRRRRQHPVHFGRSSTFVETVDVPILEKYSERFLRACNYYGLVELEYKFDARDGQYKLLDVNARTWGYHSLGACAGVDFSYMLFADQVGWPLTPCTGKPEIGWVRMTTDLPAAFMAVLERDTDIMSYLHSMKNCRVEAVFSPRDPLPGLVEILMLPYLAYRKGF